MGRLTNFSFLVTFLLFFTHNIKCQLRNPGQKGEKGEPGEPARGLPGPPGDPYPEPPIPGEPGFPGNDSAVSLTNLVRLIIREQWLLFSDLEILPDDYYYEREGPFEPVEPIRPINPDQREGVSIPKEQSRK